jgi:aspartate/methionine/tyrosine aminotransferase
MAGARSRGVRPRALVVINPGNPTGAVLDRANVEMVLDLARRHGLAILADEVYQDNLWRPGDRFDSFASVLERKGIRDVSLFSLHSASKGYLGECGHRGGYLEVRNVPPEVQDEITKLQSIGLCANSVGQIVTWLLVRPPRPGDPSFATWDAERRAILVNPVTGAMYAFPRIELPPGATDLDWCLALLEETGICVVPGSGFGQADGTWHFRTTILPPEAEIEGVVRRIADFHVAFRARGGKPRTRP